MGEVIVNRVKADWQDRLRDYRIFVDGAKVSSVGNGAQVRIPVTDGDHEIRLGIDWCKSNIVWINVSAGRVTVLDCGPNAKPWSVLLYITFLCNVYLWLREHDIERNSVARMKKNEARYNGKIAGYIYLAGGAVLMAMSAWTHSKGFCLGLGGFCFVFGLWRIYRSLQH